MAMKIRVACSTNYHDIASRLYFNKKDQKSGSMGDGQEGVRGRLGMFLVFIWMVVTQLCTRIKTIELHTFDVCAPGTLLYFISYLQVR